MVGKSNFNENTVVELEWDLGFVNCNSAIKELFVNEIIHRIKCVNMSFYMILSFLLDVPEQINHWSHPGEREDCIQN